MTKKELKTGMFGKENDGELFVIVGDRIIYEGGCYADISDLNENLEWCDDAHICELYECKCFDEVKDGSATLIWKREEQKSEKAAERKDAITITVDEFLKVAEKVNVEWMRVAEEKGDMDLVGAIVGIQNTTFAAHLAAELFG